MKFLTAFEQFLHRADGDDSRLTSRGSAPAGVVFDAKGHAKLPDRETANRLKQYWGERLDSLGKVLIEFSG